MNFENLDIEFRINLIEKEMNNFIEYLEKNEFDDLFDRKYLIDLLILIELFDLKLNSEISEIGKRINKKIKEEFF